MQPRDILILVPALILCGCTLGRKEQPSPYAGPQLNVTLTHVSGTPLSGATSRPVSTPSAADAAIARVTFVSFEKMPVSAGVPLGTQLRVLAAARGGVPVLPTARLTRDTRALFIADPRALSPALGAAGGNSATLSQLEGAVPTGASAVFAAADPKSLFDAAGREVRRQIEIIVHSSAPGSHQIALAVDDYIDANVRELSAVPTGEESTPARPMWVMQRELAIVDRPAPPADALALIIPMQFEGQEGAAVAAIVEILPGDNSPEHQQRFARARDDIARSIAQAATRPTIATIGIAESSTFDIALAALERPRQRRSSLVLLAGETGASLCEQVALVAEDDALEKLAREIANEAAPANKATAQTLGWTLDRVTFTMLGRLLGEDKLSPELAAVLVAHAGEAGRTPASVEELTRSLASRSEHENRLLAENLIFLEDSSPSARVRAFDWLKARGRAPAAYEPLDPPRQRRAALEAFYNPPAASAPTAGGKP